MQKISPKNNPIGNLGTFPFLKQKVNLVFRVISFFEPYKVYKKV